MATTSLQGLRHIYAHGHIGLSDADLNVASFVKDAVVPEAPLRARASAAQTAGTAAACPVLVAA